MKEEIMKTMKAIMKAMEKEIMKAMKEDYSGGYGGRNNEDYEGYNEGYEGRNNGGKTMVKAIEGGK